MAQTINIKAIIPHFQIWDRFANYIYSYGKKQVANQKKIQDDEKK